MTPVKRKISATLANNSRNKRGNKMRHPEKRQRIHIPVKHEPGMNVILPEGWFSQMGSDEEDEGKGEENKNGKKNDENEPSTSAMAAAVTVAAAIKVNKKTKPRKRKPMKKQKLAVARAKWAAQSKATEGANCEVIEISDGEDLFEAFPPKNAEMEKGASAMNEKNGNGEDEEDDVVLLFESSKKKNEEGKSVENEQEANIIEECMREENNGNGKLQEKTAAVDSMVPHQLSPAKSQAAIFVGKVDWPSVFHVNICPEKRTILRISKYRDKFRKLFQQFDKAIWDHLSQNLQNDHTFIWKMRVRNFLNNTIQRFYSSCELIAVGSTVNGCGAFNSDMDLCLCLPCNEKGFDTPRNYATKHLKKVMRLLWKETKIIKSIQFIPAKVPILNINFLPPYQTLEVDMNVNNTPGIYNSFLLHYYSKIDDRLPALCLLVKHWAKKRGILDACNGFFNSYSIILMVLHFLQCAVEPPILPNLQALYPDYFAFQKSISEMKLFSPLPHPLPEVPKNELSVGELLIAFFLYYDRFNFDHEGISIRLGRTFRRSHLPQNTKRFKVFIEEPFDQQNTARCVTGDNQWAYILQEFRQATIAMFGNQNRAPSLEYLIG